MRALRIGIPSLRPANVATGGALCGTALGMALAQTAFLSGDGTADGFSIGSMLTLLVFGGVTAFVASIVGGILGLALGGVGWGFARGTMRLRLAIDAARSPGSARAALPPAEIARVVRGRAQVVSADGLPLGRVTRVWRGEDPESPGQPWDAASCSRLQLWWGRDALYVPCSLVRTVGEDRVTLAVDRAEAVASAARPKWIPAHRRPETPPASARPSAPPVSHVGAAVGRGAAAAETADLMLRYAVSFVLWLSTVALGYFVVWLVWRPMIGAVIAAVVGDGDVGAQNVGSVVYLFSGIAVGIGLFVMVVAGEPYLRNGVESGLLVRRFARLSLPLLALGAVGVAVAELLARFG